MNEAEYKAAVLAAGKAWVPLSIIRGDDWTLTWRFKNVDYSGASFAGQIRLVPDAVGDPLASWTAGTPVFSGGHTTVTFTLTDTQINGLPAASETGRVAKFYTDFKITVGGLINRFAAGSLTIPGKVTA